MQFIGQQPILSFFDLAVQNGQLAQAYCLAGPSQVGKRTLAHTLAAKILNVEANKLSSNPDYYYIERLEDEKTGKKKKEISVDQARELREKFYNRSWLNGYKIAIIDEAELLSEEASNALLKILEEPPTKSIIFLLTENDFLLLPTIRSRCQVLQLRPVPDLEIEKYLRSISDDKNIKEIVELSWGRPGRAIDMQNNLELFENCLKEKKRWLKIINVPMYERWREMEDILGEKGGLIKIKEKLDPILDLWMMLWRSKMLSDKYPNERYRMIIDEIKNIKNLLAANVNPRLAIEQFLAKI
jgi:DNA polymerase-3 subunit delta'